METKSITLIHVDHNKIININSISNTLPTRTITVDEQHNSKEEKNDLTDTKDHVATTSTSPSSSSTKDTRFLLFLIIS
jgi:hypothetical protein